MRTNGKADHQPAGISLLVVAAALAVLAFFPGVKPGDTPGGARGLTGDMTASKTLGEQPVTFVPPEDITPAELADDGASLVVATCSACHSLEYITTQPRGMGEKFWQDSVTKMVKVYAAPIDQADADAIARILADRFG